MVRRESGAGGLTVVDLYAALLCLAAAPAHADGDAAKNEIVFKKCVACHAVGEGAKNKVGPELNGIFGRKVTAVEGFNYSPAFKAKAEEGWVWDETHMTEYRANPRKYVKGTKMAFPGLKKPEDLANIAYLKAFDTP